LDYFDEKPDYVELVTGGMDDVGQAMSRALFHIGNDAGITHVAGAFNVPMVGIYGPTGPGAWGCFSQQSEIVWGKSGHCDKRCNYEVILNCADRVCLSTTTNDKVLGALYKLLQKAYPDFVQQYAIHPSLKADFTDKDCLLTLDKNEYLIQFADTRIRKNITKLLNGNISGEMDQEMAQLAVFLISQDILFSIPIFPKQKSDPQAAL
jgi:hypothetical protein